MNTKQYSFYYSSVNFAMCVYSVYIMLYLSESGYTAFEIGLFTALSGIVGIAAQLFWGAIADRVSVPKLLVIIMLLMIGVSFSINAVPDAWRVYFILAVVFLQSPITLLSETWALTGNQSLAARFGFIRGLGSLGWGLSSLVSGTLIGWLGFEAMFPLYAVLFIIPMAVMIAVMRYSTKSPAQVEAQAGCVSESGESDSSNQAENHSVNGSYRGMFGSLFIAVVLFLTFAGQCQGIFGFMPLFIQELGGDSSYLGLYTLVMTLCEIPLFIYSDRIFNRYSLRSIMLFMLLAYALRFILHWTSYSLVVVLALSILQALTYPLLFIVGKRLVLQTVSRNNLNTAFGLLASIQSLFGIGFSVLYGWVMEAFQIRTLFIVGLILCLISYGIYRIFLYNRIDTHNIQTNL
ncbi:MFS transporter [Paenibacillus marinisediminis]